MASGLPIIAVRALALPELVHDGENGALFTPQDIDSLTKHIQHLFSSKQTREAMGKKSREIIQAHDISKTIDTFEKLYEELISTRPYPSPKILDP